MNQKLHFYLAAVVFAAVAVVPSFAEYSEAERNEILLKHNVLRAGVSPPAADMMELKWSSSLALSAESTANTCPEQSSVAASNNVDESIAWGPTSYRPANFIAKWAEEGSHYDYDSKSCFSSDCEHFKKVLHKHCIVIVIVPASHILLAGCVCADH